MTQNDNSDNEDKITSKFDDKRDVIWASAEDALIFSADVARRSGRRIAFEKVYMQVHGKFPKHKQFKEYAEGDLAGAIERAVMSDGSSFADALAEKMNR